VSIKHLAGALLVLGLLLPRAARPAAVPIDGTLDPAYGVALSTQTTATVGWPDASLGLVGGSNGYELDQAYGFVSGGTLHLFLSGNLLCQGNPVDPGIYTYNLYLFIDSGAGGQNRMRADNADLDYGSLNRMAGLTFDAGFEPDYRLACRGYLLGTIGAGGPGTLSGGTNPDGIQVTIDNRNTAGVTSGCGAWSGAGVTTGVEWAIPLAAIGDPAGCVRVCAVVATSAAYTFLPQVLGPLPAGSCTLGAPSGVDFNLYAGDQFFTVCGEGVPASTPSWGRLKTLYR
jgi:hypothetical protein